MGSSCSGISQTSHCGLMITQDHHVAHHVLGVLTSEASPQSFGLVTRRSETHPEAHDGPTTFLAASPSHK